MQIRFIGMATDTEDGVLTGGSLVWTTDLDGQIGIGTTFMRSLSRGAHTITLTATDSANQTGTDAIALTIE